MLRPRAPGRSGKQQRLQKLNASIVSRILLNRFMASPCRGFVAHQGEETLCNLGFYSSGLGMGAILAGEWVGRMSMVKSQMISTALANAQYPSFPIIADEAACAGHKIMAVLWNLQHKRGLGTYQEMDVLNTQASVTDATADQVVNRILNKMLGRQ
eukprot:12425901-Karenia_brevis.AAC.1